MDPIPYTAVPGFPILSLIVLLPLAAAAAAAFSPGPAAARRLALAGAAAAALLSLCVPAVHDPAVAGLQMAERLAWLPSLGISYALGVDGISVLFLPMTGLLFLAALAVAPEVAGGRNRWVDVNLLVLMAATSGCFAAADAMLFFVFFEMTLLPGYFLIKLAGGGAQSARRYMVLMLLGSLPVMAGLVLAGTAGGAPDFHLTGLAHAALSEPLQLAVFAALALGFAIKAPAVPLHLWIVPSVAAAPAALMAWILGVKIGTYGFLRFAVPLAPAAAAELAPWIIALEVVAIVYAGLIALSRRDLRSLLVFASIGHVGLMTAAVFSGTEDGWRGALLMMLNAGLATGGLALLTGMVERRTGTSDLRALGGLIGTAPRLTAAIFVAGLALIGVPGTSGFAGEILALKGVFDAGWGFGLVAVAGVVLSAAYFLTAYQRGFLGPASASAAAAADLRGRERGFAAGLIVLILALGLAPGLPERLTRASVAAEIERQSAVLAARAAPPVRLAMLPHPATRGED